MYLEYVYIYAKPILYLQHLHNPVLAFIHTHSTSTTLYSNLPTVLPHNVQYLYIQWLILSHIHWCKKCELIFFSGELKFLIQQACHFLAPTGYDHGVFFFTRFQLFFLLCVSACLFLHRKLFIIFSWSDTVRPWRSL